MMVKLLSPLNLVYYPNPGSGMVRSGDDSPQPSEYVQQNEQQLERLIKHSNNDFVRALAIAAIVEYGGDASVDSITADLERIKELKDDRR